MELWGLKYTTLGNHEKNESKGKPKVTRHKWRSDRSAKGLGWEARDIMLLEIKKKRKDGSHWRHASSKIR